MGSIAAALVRAGVVSERSAREAEAERVLRAEMENARGVQATMKKEKLLADLRGLSSPDKFRSLARKVLLLDPKLIRDVISIAHNRGMQAKKQQGGGRLIADLLQTRTKLDVRGLSDDAMREIVDKTFPKK